MSDQPAEPALSFTAFVLSLASTAAIHFSDLPDPIEHFDPVGLELVDEKRGSIGRVTDVIVTGANDVWVVEGPLGEILIPVIDDVIMDIDDDTGTVRVRLLPGLIEGS